MGILRIYDEYVGLVSSTGNMLNFFWPGGAVLHHLLEWVQNGHADKYIRDVLQHSQPHDSPSYWPAVSI